MNSTQLNREEVERCKAFIRSEFLQIPSIRSVAFMSLFHSGGTFTDVEVIKAAVKEVKPEELFTREKK